LRSWCVRSFDAPTQNTLTFQAKDPASIAFGPGPDVIALIPRIEAAAPAGIDAFRL
jgi:hypothetical protein